MPENIPHDSKCPHCDSPIFFLQDACPKCGKKSSVNERIPVVGTQREDTVVEKVGGKLEITVGIRTGVFALIITIIGAICRAIALSDPSPPWERSMMMVILSGIGLIFLLLGGVVGFMAVARADGRVCGWISMLIVAAHAFHLWRLIG